eukprot:494455-Alexandrium_andersonii.AAC.1
MSAFVFQFTPALLGSIGSIRYSVRSVLGFLRFQQPPAVSCASSPGGWGLPAPSRDPSSHNKLLQR